MTDKSLDNPSNLPTAPNTDDPSPGANLGRRGPSLTFSITVLVTLVLILTILLTLSATIYQVNRVLTEQLEREAQTSVHLFARNVASALNLLNTVETALGDQMVVQAQIAAHLAAVAERAGLSPAEINAILADIADHSVVDEFNITDESARVYLTNTGQTFVFSPSPLEQPLGSQFFQLLNQQRGIVVQETQPRERDGETFKYVGVSGVDRPRIVQVGYRPTVIDELNRAYSLQALMNDMVGRSEVRYVRMVDSEMNTVAYGSDSAQGEAASPAEETEDRDDADARTAIATAQTTLRWEPEALVVVAPISTTRDGQEQVWGAAIVHLSTENLNRVRQEAILGGLALGGLMCIFGILASYWLASRIVHPLRSMVKLTREVADGDLSRQIEVRRRAEMGELEAALGQMTESLRATIQRIRESARRVRFSSRDVETVVGELNQAANQQSAAVTETTTAMEELRAVAQQIASGSQTVSDTAAQTQNDVQSGLEAVSETVIRMEEIRSGNEASVNEILALGQRARQIGMVMDLIDDIAAQTKLIAINASIEAAAAGEAGHRFGVVAAQVRHLADNVAKSTVEIRHRIGEIQTATNELVIAAEQGTKKINQGVALSQTTQEALMQIADSADQTSISARQISISTRQQQTAVEQVVEALQNLSMEVNRIAASSDQATRIVADLGHLSDGLNELVALFQL